MEEAKVAKKEGYEDIVSEIRSISKSVQRLLTSRLTERAIVILIWDSLPAATYRSPRVGKKNILEVLHSAANLENFYLKKLKNSKEV